MDERQRSGLERIRADTTSGATDLVLAAAALLLTAAGDDALRRQLARACVDAQPSMAGMLTLEHASADADDPDAAVVRFAERVRRAPSLIARHAAPLLLLGASGDQPSSPPLLTIVTVSSSRAVEETLALLAREATVVVRCGEGRPMNEGVGLAQRLSARGLGVELFTDAGLSSAVAGAHAVLVGADAITAGWFVNKVGTGAICALALHLGVPAYVLAGREKLLSVTQFAQLAWRDGPSAEVLPLPLGQVEVKNPYFERVS